MRPFDKTQLHLLAVGSTVGLWQEQLGKQSFIKVRLERISELQMNHSRHISTADVLVFVVDGSDEFDEVLTSQSSQ